MMTASKSVAVSDRTFRANAWMGILRLRSLGDERPSPQPSPRKRGEGACRYSLAPHPRGEGACRYSLAPHPRGEGGGPRQRVGEGLKATRPAGYQDSFNP